MEARPIPSTPTADTFQTFNGLTGAQLLSFGYDSGGRLSSITDNAGNVTQITHDADGNPTAIVAPFGQTTQLAVDNNGFMSSITDPAGATIQLANSPTGLLKTYTDARGNVHTFDYDASGKLLKDEDPAGGATTLSDVADGSSHTVTTQTRDTAPEHLEMSVSAQGYGEVITQPLHLTSSTLQTPFGQYTAHDPDGTVTTVDYAPDPRFGLIAPIAGVTTIAMPSGLTWSAFDVRTASQVNPSNPLSVGTLDDVTTINGNPWTSEYAADAGTIRSTSPAGRTTTEQLDALGRVVEVREPNINPVTLTYDASGRVSTIAQGERTLTVDYGDAGTLSDLVDPLGEAMAFQEDPDGRVANVIDPAGEPTLFSYDPSGNTSTIAPPRKAGS